MKVSVTVSLEVDPSTWTTIYGIAGAASIREDVRCYVREQLQGSAAAEEGGLVSVTIK